MTVKCLNDQQKQLVASQFAYGFPIDYIAEQHSVSRRTVIRTLEEIGIEPGIKRRKRLPKPTPLPPGPIPTTPWWKRIIPWVSNVTSRRFQA